LALHGELGAGKTTFIKGLAEGLKIKKTITSPTFVLMNVYPVTKNEQAVIRFVHVDAYRVAKAKDFLAIGLDEYIDDDHSVVAIEWAENIKAILPKHTKHIRFAQIQDRPRTVSITIADK